MLQLKNFYKRHYVESFVKRKAFLGVKVLKAKMTLLFSISLYKPKERQKRACLFSHRLWSKCLIVLCVLPGKSRGSVTHVSVGADDLTVACGALYF